MFGFPLPIAHWVIGYGIGFLILALLVRMIASWFRLDERFAIIRFLARLTDPFLTPLDRLVRPVSIGPMVMRVSFLFVWFMLSTAEILLIQGLPAGW